MQCVHQVDLKMNKMVLNKIFLILISSDVVIFCKVRFDDDRHYAEATRLIVKKIRWNDVTIEGLQTTNYIYSY